MLSFLTTPITRVADFARKHKTKIAVVSTLATAASAFAAYTYFKPTIDDLISQFKLMRELEKQMRGVSAQRKTLDQKFVHMMRVGDVTVKDFARKLLSEVMRMYNVEGILQNLQQTKNTKGGHDLEQWNTFKNLGFVRMYVSLYSICLSHVLVKVELSIVSRYLFADNQQNRGEEQKERGTSLDVVNGFFFRFVEHSQTTGFNNLAKVVQASVESVVQSWELKTLVTYDQVLELLQAIRAETDKLLFADDTFLQFLLPSPEETAAQLLRLSHELRATLRRSANAASHPQTAGTSQPPNDPSSHPSPSAIDMGSWELEEAGIARLAEMVAELQALLKCRSFKAVVNATLDCAFRELETQLRSPFAKDIQSALPFVKVLNTTVQAFGRLLPLNDLDHSPVLQRLEQPDSAVYAFCSIVYYPLQVGGGPLTGPPPPENEQGLEGLLASLSEAERSQFQALLGGGEGGDIPRQFEALLGSGGMAGLETR